MNLKSGFRGALRRMQETRVPALLRQSISAMRSSNTKIHAAAPRRRTAVLPSTLTGYPSREALPKPTPINLRKFVRI